MKRSENELLMAALVARREAQDDDDESQWEEITRAIKALTPTWAQSILEGIAILAMNYKDDAAFESAANLLDCLIRQLEDQDCGIAATMIRYTINESSPGDFLEDYLPKR